MPLLAVREPLTPGEQVFDLGDLIQRKAIDRRYCGPDQRENVLPHEPVCGRPRGTRTLAAKLVGGIFCHVVVGRTSGCVFPV